MSDRRHQAGDHPPAWPYHLVFAGIGAVLGLGSPIGAFLARWWRADPVIFSLWARMDLSDNFFFYGYMGVGTILAFAAFGWYAGKHIESHRVHNQDLRRRVEELHLRSVTDGMTGAFSHAYLQEALSIELERARREGHPLSVLMLDLDDFKKLNDGHGHLFGDRVLKELTETASMNIRQEDVLGRYGGEEFLVIMPGADAEVAAQVAERVRKAFERASIVPIHGGVPVRTTVSIGAASGDGRDGLDALGLIALADKRLYAAKRAGKNRVVDSEA
ncbi:MAG: GGDEF domain-containing protein [Elusimicrobia bacterium]|nr:GGDEF domain-containing protein [Elusimicrobiota bacterium]